MTDGHMGRNESGSDFLSPKVSLVPKMEVPVLNLIKSAISWGWGKSPLNKALHPYSLLYR